MTVRDWRTCNVEFQPFFELSDLWVSFKEWSAYGAGVPLLLNDSDGVVQYYVPYLSGIQLYADLSKSTTKLRYVNEIHVICSVVLLKLNTMKNDF